jgi:hypothetical protein
MLTGKGHRALPFGMQAVELFGEALATSLGLFLESAASSLGLSESLFDQICDLSTGMPVRTCFCHFVCLPLGCNELYEVRMARFRLARLRGTLDLVLHPLGVEDELQLFRRAEASGSFQDAELFELGDDLVNRLVERELVRFDHHLRLQRRLVR